MNDSQMIDVECAIHATHKMIAPKSFRAEAGAGQETCARCHTCTCHDQGATLTEPCAAALAGSMS